MGPFLENLRALTAFLRVIMRKLVRNTSGVAMMLAVVFILSATHQRWRLGRAARRGDLASIKHYHDRGFDVNAVDFVSGKTPLSLSVESGKFDAFELLIKFGASADITGRDGLSSTDLTASKQDSAWLKLALSNGADPNRFNKAIGYNYGTPLYFAIKNGKPVNVLTLLENGANPENLVDISGATALTRASAFAQWDIVILLLRRGADVCAGPQGGNFIESLKQRDFSAHLDEFETIKTLLGSDFDPQIVFRDSYFGRDGKGKPILTPPK